MASSVRVSACIFRATERHIFKAHGKQALSAVKDMIGSQATKGMHALAKFAPLQDSIGVWTDAHGLRVIEACSASILTVGLSPLRRILTMLAFAPS